MKQTKLRDKIEEILDTFNVTGVHTNLAADKLEALIADEKKNLLDELLSKKQELHGINPGAGLFWVLSDFIEKFMKDLDNQAGEK